MKKLAKKFGGIIFFRNFAPFFTGYDKKDTKWSVRLGVRTPGFHPGSRGSIPLRTTQKKALNFSAFFVLKVFLADKPIDFF